MRLGRMVGCVVALAVLMAGCTPKPLEPAQAIQHYDAVLTDVQGAIAPLGLTYKPVRGRTAKIVDGTCRYLPGYLDPVTPMTPSVFESPGWTATHATIGAALTQAGFGEIGAPERLGGMQAVRSTDNAGATFTLLNDGSFWIVGVPIDAPDCSPQGIGLP